MERGPFLRDIDDWKHYGELLEVAYAEAYTEVNKILEESNLHESYKPGGLHGEPELHVSYEDLARLRFVMSCTVQQSGERVRRLANVARRLADVVLDEEGSKE